jgi:hypothetical protein
MRQERRETSWTSVIWRPALRASLMAALSGLLVVVTVSGHPLGGEGVFVVDLDGLGLAGGELVIGEGEAGSSGLQPGEDQDQGVLRGVGARGVGSGQLGEALGLLLPVGGLAVKVLDHPAGGGNRCAEAFRYGLGGQRRLVAFLGQQGGLQLGEGIGAGVVVIGLQLFGEQTDAGGALLGLDAQLPERGRSARRTFRCDALQGADRTGGSGRVRDERRGGRGEESHGNGEQSDGADPQHRAGMGRTGGSRSGREGLGGEGLRDLHHRDGYGGTGGRTAGLLHQRGGAGPTGEGDHQH